MKRTRLQDHNQKYPKEGDMAYAAHNIAKYFVPASTATDLMRA
jgi:hypothetical protein